MKPYGILAEFANPDKLWEACERVRDSGFTHWDAHTPFPIHGLERAMGLKRSWVSLAVLTLGLAGAAVGMGLQWWASTQAYPLVVSGKPMFSWPAFVPIMFECGVLGGAMGAFFGFLGLSRLPQHNHPLFNSTRFEGFSDDRFFISIEAKDPKFDREGTESLLRQAGAQHIEMVEA